MENFYSRAACSYSYYKNHDKCCVSRIFRVIGAFFLGLCGSYKVNVAEAKRLVTSHPEYADKYFVRELRKRKIIITPPGPSPIRIPATSSVVGVNAQNIEAQRMPKSSRDEWRQSRQRNGSFVIGDHSSSSQLNQADSSPFALPVQLNAEDGREVATDFSRENGFATFSGASLEAFHSDTQERNEIPHHTTPGDINDEDLLSLPNASEEPWVSEDQIRNIKSIFEGKNEEELSLLKINLGGISPVYCLPEYPDFVIKKDDSSVRMDRFTELQPCLRTSPHLSIARVQRLNADYVLEEKLPLPSTVHRIIKGYLSHADEFTPAVKELTRLVCRGVELTDVRPTDGNNLYPGIMRYDNIAPIVYERRGRKVFKIALVDSGAVSINESFDVAESRDYRERLPILLEFKKQIDQLIGLFPLHEEQIREAIKEELKSVKDIDNWFPTCNVRERVNTLHTSVDNYENYLVQKGRTIETPPLKIAHAGNHCDHMSDNLNGDALLVVNALIEKINHHIEGLGKLHRPIKMDDLIINVYDLDLSENLHEDLVARVKSGNSLILNAIDFLSRRNDVFNHPYSGLYVLL